jgi:hypothetical protein
MIFVKKYTKVLVDDPFCGSHLMTGESKIDEQMVQAEFMSPGEAELTNIIGAIDSAQKHYQIHKNQFKIGTYLSIVPFQVSWGEFASYWGNEIYPGEMKSKPEFKIKADKSNYWTITISSLDR